ncbi:MAG: hypothetical protein H6684_06475 [Deltaproteobacteria bacterium]|nr:hypothetical protein [Deltaproteobacteria bacterium]MCB9488358.1 hypothetical protein [Deltaproteobacteria bacterium]
MRTKTIFILILTMLLSTSIVMSVACGGGDDDDDDSSSSGDDDDDDDAVSTDPVLKGHVRDFQTKTPVQNAKVEVLNDETGEVLDDALTISATPGDGAVEWDLSGYDVETVGIRVTKAGEFTDTVQFHFEVGLTDEEFLLVSNATRDLIEAVTGILLDTSKSVVAGGIYWGDAVDENPLGCAVAEVEGFTGEMHYFGPDALPALSRDVTGATPGNGQGTNLARATSDNQALSYYIAANVDPTLTDDGDINLNGTVYDDPCNGTADAAKAESDVVPKLYVNTVSIANVYFSKEDYPESPTPSWCTSTVGNSGAC